MITLPDADLLWVVAGIFAVLIVGSLVRMLALRTADPGVVLSRMGSLKSWWIVFGLTAAAVLIGRLGAVLLLGTASFLALREYLNITIRGTPRGILFVVALAVVPVHYAAILGQWSFAAAALIPVGSVMLLAGIGALRGPTGGYVQRIAAILFGLLVTVYLVSHAAMLFTLPQRDPSPQRGSSGLGPAGWFLYLVILTECNDIAQALIGRRLGRRKICPQVSPQKTWEGLLGGLLVTVLLAVTLAPFLTPLADERWLQQQRMWWPQAYLWAAPLGMMISLLGFVGDITMSAVKRDAGVKDGSTLLPGQGGMIDRVDSLTFTAPAVYYFVRWLTDTPTGSGL